MSNGYLNWIANYIWGIADDVLRDLYVRGKYRDVILPMTMLRRLDAARIATAPGQVPKRKAVIIIPKAMHADMANLLRRS